MILERVKPADPAKPDPDAYRPIPDRPGWLINGRGQMAKQGTLPPPIIDPFKGLPVKA